MDRFRLVSISVCLAVVVLALAAADTSSPISLLNLIPQDPDSPQVLLERALQKVQDAGSFQIDVSLDQTVRENTPLDFNMAEETAHFDLEGTVDAPNRVRFSILPGRTSFALAQRDPQEFLVVDEGVYQRQEDRWVETDSNVPGIEVDGVGLSMLSVARDVELMEPAQGPPMLGEYTPTFRRVGFKLYPDDVRDYLLLQQGIDDDRAKIVARISAPIIKGTGELWLDDAGYPARLVLNLTREERGEDSYRTVLLSTTDYSNFGKPLQDSYFDPFASVQTGEPLDLALMQRRPESLVWLFATLVGACFVWLIALAGRGCRKASVAVTIAVLVALLAPTLTPVARAAGLGAPPEDQAENSPPAEGSEVARMFTELTMCVFVVSMHVASPGLRLSLGLSV